MSAGFRAVQWNRAQLVYDGILLAGVVLYIGAYLTLVYWLDPPKDQLAAIDLRIRAFGTCAFFMLTVILSIGPLTRLDRRFLPLLYNRRHFGVLTFFVVLLHVSFMVEWFAVQDALPSLSRRTDQSLRLWQVHRLSLQGAGPRRAPHPVPDGGDQPRLLARLLDPVGLEGSAHGALRRVWARRDACRARRHAVRPQSVYPSDAGKRLCLRDGAPSRGRLARAGGRPRRRSGQRGLALGRTAPLDSGQGRPHRRGAGWRTHRSLPRRSADRGAFESLRPPAWPDRRRAHHRRLRDLPLARLPVPSAGRLRAAAVHRKARHLPRARCAWRGRSRPAPAATGYARGDQV